MLLSLARILASEVIAGGTTLTPTEKNWLESGKILGKMFTDKGFSPAKLSIYILAY
jgi:hypothetical protein